MLKILRVISGVLRGSFPMKAKLQRNLDESIVALQDSQMQLQKALNDSLAAQTKLTELLKKADQRADALINKDGLNSQLTIQNEMSKKLSKRLQQVENAIKEGKVKLEDLKRRC